ncbi:hypothetical protein K6U21_03825 [Vibrio vulnificus]|uniref:hypothetical protein n=1 Tax=Vibrio vulnificus TaxID=672 RepID=UPI001EEC8C41|nr:hypothetical protein [Vibrio vulnificus]MCG6303328.1 hypothetical protein [Vibrio vulnificus]
MSHLILCYYNIFLITSVCQSLSVSQFVILAKAGIHRTVSVVARRYRFTDAVGLLSVGVSVFPNVTSGVCG